MNWHVPEGLAVAYSVGEVQGARAASIEAHVMSCETCRSLVAAAVPDARLAAIWTAVADKVDAPRSTWSERLLRTAGMSESDSRLVSAAPALHLSWLTSLTAVLLFAVWASNTSDRGATLFLIVAPVVPVLAVMGAYGARIDPTYEISVASPYPTLRLVLLRSATVVAVSGALALVASALVPQGQMAAAWLLPCLALVMLTLILTRWVPQPVAAGVVAAGYALPLLMALVNDRDVSSVVTSAALQLAAAAVAGAALIAMTTDPQLRTALRRNR